MLSVMMYRSGRPKLHWYSQPLSTARHRLIQNAPSTNRPVAESEGWYSSARSIAVPDHTAEIPSRYLAPEGRGGGEAFKLTLWGPYVHHSARFGVGRLPAAVFCHELRTIRNLATVRAYLAINEGDSGLRLYYTICRICKFRIILDYQILDYQKNTPLYL